MAELVQEKKRQAPHGWASPPPPPAPLPYNLLLCIVPFLVNFRRVNTFLLVSCHRHVDFTLSPHCSHTGFSSTFLQQGRTGQQRCFLRLIAPHKSAFSNQELLIHASREGEGALQDKVTVKSRKCAALVYNNKYAWAFSPWGFLTLQCDLPLP
jgi:hypothetical protein